MSIILDALNKEHAPKPGAIPTLATEVHSAPQPASPRGLSSAHAMMLVTSLLAIGALALSVYTLWWRPAPGPIPKAEHSQQTQLASIPESNSAAAVPDKALPMRTESDRAVVTVAPVKPAPAKLPPRNQPVEPKAKPIQAGAPPTPRPKTAIAARTAAPTARRVPQVEKPAVAPRSAPAAPVIEQPHPSTTALLQDLNLLKQELESQELETKDAEPSPQRDEVVVTELAQSTKVQDREYSKDKTVPPAVSFGAGLSYKILVHMYADLPSERLVVIDGKRLREGDVLDRKYRIDAITKSGVLLNDGQAKVELKVNSR